VVKQTINVEIPRELWKAVGKACIDLEIDKRDFLEMALVEKLERLRAQARE